MPRRQGRFGDDDDSGAIEPWPSWANLAWSWAAVTTLGALLLNPPLTGGTRTIRHLQVAADLLGCDSVEIANLFSISTGDVTVINEVGRADNGWKLAQSRLAKVIVESDQLLAGWGVSGLVGQAAQNRRKQLDYIRTCAWEAGKDYIWTLDGEARHPSRWHQYVSDRHGRASGATLGERLSKVLTSVLLATLGPQGRRDIPITTSQPDSPRWFQDESGSRPAG